MAAANEFASDVGLALLRRGQPYTENSKIIQVVYESADGKRCTGYAQLEPGDGEEKLVRVALQPESRYRPLDESAGSSRRDHRRHRPAT